MLLPPTINWVCLCNCSRSTSYIWYKRKSNYWKCSYKWPATFCKRTIIWFTPNSTTSNIQ